MFDKTFYPAKCLTESCCREMPVNRHLHNRREYQNAIRKILVNKWDPIGVAHEPDAQDEYDCYIQSIYELLIHHEDEKRIFDYLCDSETKDMELRGDHRRIKDTVKRLLELKKEMEKI